MKPKNNDPVIDILARKIEDSVHEMIKIATLNPRDIETVVSGAQQFLNVRLRFNREFNALISLAKANHAKTTHNRKRVSPRIRRGTKAKRK